MLRNKTAIITGGTSGIGKAIAFCFAGQGANVAIFGTNEDRAREIIEELENRKIDADQQFSYFLPDIANTQAVLESVELFLAQNKAPDILINNAGIVRDNLLIRMTEDEWDRVIAVNLKSAYNTCRAFTRSMMRARQGKIINVTSVIGLTGNAGQANYAASKAGIIGFSKSLAKELAPRNISVNCIAPGYIQTAMTEKLSASIKESIISKIPLSRMGLPEDIAKVALFLASDLADYMTGQVLSVDGGMVL